MVMAMVFPCASARTGDASVARTPYQGVYLLETALPSLSFMADRTGRCRHRPYGRPGVSGMGAS
jgi:hypothetical protein